MTPTVRRRPAARRGEGWGGARGDRREGAAGARGRATIDFARRCTEYGAWRVSARCHWAGARCLYVLGLNGFIATLRARRGRARAAAFEEDFK